MLRPLTDGELAANHHALQLGVENRVEAARHKPYPISTVWSPDQGNDADHEGPFDCPEDAPESSCVAGQERRDEK